MNPQQPQDPFAPKYGGNPGQQQPMQMPNMPLSPMKPIKSGPKSVGLLVSLVLSILLLLGALGFGIWAFSGMQDYKNHSDQKSAAAVKIAEEQTSSAKDKEFVEKEKNPLKEYKGPAAFGTISIQYPKTWGAFVTEADNNSGTPVDGYFHPNFVPGLQSGADYALRVKVVNKQYTDELQQFQGKVKQGKITVVPYIPVNVAGATPGSRVTGEINTGQQDVLILLPLRDKTIEISTESAQFVNDFNTIILAHLTYLP